MKRNIRITRSKHAGGTNLFDQDQPVIRVYIGHDAPILMGRWSTLCLAEGAITADQATNEQIIRALTTDESVF